DDNGRIPRPQDPAPGRLPADYRFGPRSGRLFEPCHQRDRSAGRQGMGRPAAVRAGPAVRRTAHHGGGTREDGSIAAGEGEIFSGEAFLTADGNDSHPERSVEAPDLKTKRWRGSDGTLK